MIVSVDIGGTSYLVEIEGEDEYPAQVILKGHRVDVDIAREWGKEFVKSLIVGEQSFRVEFEYSENGIPKSVWVNGVPSTVKIDFPGKGKLTDQAITPGVGSLDDRIVAPIPGKISEIRVHEGQRVAAGEVLIILEAMKMENELPSPRDAVVKKVLCREGDNVNLEQTLVNLEPE